jgi:methionyl-tRNA synthetase
MSVYVTTPIFYPNAVPHLGTTYPAIAADIFARWSRSFGEETRFLTGTDEHGRKIEKAAQAEGLAPKPFVDLVSAKFHHLFSLVDIEPSRFIRTTDTDHLEMVAEALRAMRAKGDIYEGTYAGLYCVECETYYKEEELSSGRCPVHQIKAEFLEEACYYFTLSAYRDWLLDLYHQNPEFVRPRARMNEVVEFVKSGLEDLCISRSSVSWGIPLPFARSHVTYVWFDALLNYLTGIGYLGSSDMFARFWPNVVHIIGKDILKFHAVIWPAMLKSLGVAPPKSILAHGFWTADGRKFSKHSGGLLDVAALIDAYGQDPLRYFLFRETPFGLDGNFDEGRLVERNNVELAQGLGNLFQRTVSMLVRYRNGCIPVLPVEREEREALVAQAANRTVESANAHMQEFRFREALESIWEFIAVVNRYTNLLSPWSLADRGADSQLDFCLGTLSEALRYLAALVTPFMPRSGAKIAQRLGLPDAPKLGTIRWGRSPTGRVAELSDHLFPLLEERRPTVDPNLGSSVERDL